MQVRKPGMFAKRALKNANYGYFDRKPRYEITFCKTVNIKAGLLQDSLPPFLPSIL